MNGDDRWPVECDGDRYHPHEKLAEDMERQAILERVGWRFIRIRGTELTRDPAATMSTVCEQLARLELLQKDAKARAALEIQPPTS